jgi:hypothetical protein
MKAPSTNIQAPEKLQVVGAGDTAAIWNLNVGASLELGTWNLEL